MELRFSALTLPALLHRWLRYGCGHDRSKQVSGALQIPIEIRQRYFDYDTGHPDEDQ